MDQYNNILDHDPYNELIPAGEKLLWSEKIKSRLDFDNYLKIKKGSYPSFFWLLGWGIVFVMLFGLFIESYSAYIISFMLFFMGLAIVVETHIVGFLDAVKIVLLKIYGFFAKFPYFSILFFVLFMTIRIDWRCIFLLFIPWAWAIYQYLKNYKTAFAISDKSIVVQKGFFTKKNYYLKVKDIINAHRFSFKNEKGYLVVQLYFQEYAVRELDEKEIVLGPLVETEEAYSALSEILEKKRANFWENDLLELESFYKRHRMEKKFSRDKINWQKGEYCLWVKDIEKYGDWTAEAFWITNKRFFYLYKNKDIVFPIGKIKRASLNKHNRIRLEFGAGFTVSKTKKKQRVIYLAFSKEEEQKQVFGILEQIMSANAVK